MAKKINTDETLRKQTLESLEQKMLQTTYQENTGMSAFFTETYLLEDEFVRSQKISGWDEKEEEEDDDEGEPYTTQ